MYSCFVVTFIVKGTGKHPIYTKDVLSYSGLSFQKDIFTYIYIYIQYIDVYIIYIVFYLPIYIYIVQINGQVLHPSH